MANDRVMIRCDGCGEWTTMLTYSHMVPVPWEGILGWLDAHAEHHPHCFAPHLNEVPGFSIHMESAVGRSLDPLKQRDHA